MSVESAFDATLPMPLPTLFDRWYGPIPPVKHVREQTGSWDAPGRTRKVVLAGGGSMREELTRIDPPASFGYRLTDITGPLAPLVSRVEGEWLFARADGGTEVTWRWTIQPRSVLARPLMPVFSRLWRGYARQSLAQLSVRLVG